MLTGIEVDMLSLGDADCIVVTKYENSVPHRIIVDGGSGSSAEEILEFLFKHGMTDFWAAICTHPHNDHAAGLIKIVKNPRIRIQTAFMHDIRKHIAPDVLRRAAAADDGVNEVVETTKELAAAFAAHTYLRQQPIEPFAGRYIADWPATTVLGPSLAFYTKALEESTKLDPPLPAPYPYSSALGSILGGVASPTASPFFSGFGRIAAPTAVSPDFASLLSGALSNSSVEEKPKTQSFNNTSAILGIVFNGHRLLFTADAGADALDAIPPEWKNLTWMQVPHHGSDGNLSQANIERFCPRFAFVSACGDSSHPSRAIVNGIMKVRHDAEVCSTHENHHLWYWNGDVPARPDYRPATVLKATGNLKPFDWSSMILGESR